MTYKNLIAGLEIFAQVEPEGMETSIAAGDGVMYVASPECMQEISTDDIASLRQLGFYYTVTEGWFFFT